MRRSLAYSAALTAVYVAAAGAWIVFSSAAAAHIASSVEQLSRFERSKGIGFVLVTGLALFIGARTLFDRFERVTDDLSLRERALINNERRVFAGLIASSVAHDANNVLATVLLDLHELRGHPEQATAILERLEAAVSSLIALNKRLVEGARQSAVAWREPIELSSAVKDAMKLARHHPALRDAHLSFVEPTSPVVLQASPMLIRQIVTNLLLNAGEATHGTGRIVIVLRSEGGTAILDVCDDGPGVPVARRAGLFDALHSTKPAGGGIGLFSVQACARAMGGSVEVLDAPTRGACFRVSLPLAASTPTP